MKKYLAGLLMTTVVFLIAVSAALARGKNRNESAFNTKQAFAAFEYSLQRTDVPGFVESTLYTIVQCKERYPQLDYGNILKVVKRVEREEENSAISYKAYLVSMYLTHSSEIHVKPVVDANEHDYLFKQIADQLEGKFLSNADDNSLVVDR